VTLLDVQGEAILIRTPQGRSLLINGGLSGPQLTQELGQALPYAAQQLDWIVVAGEREEQINGLLNGVEHLTYERVAWASQGPPQALLTLLGEMANSAHEVETLHAGQAMDLGDGIMLKALYVGPRGATLLLEWQQFAALLPVGLDLEQMESYSQDYAEQDIDLLLLADSGYTPLNRPSWLAAVNAKLHWLAGGGEVSQDVIAGAAGRSILSVSQLGWLRVSTDGRQMWLTAERR
jgi:hypothetical protein